MADSILGVTVSSLLNADSVGDRYRVLTPTVEANGTSCNATNATDCFELGPEENIIFEMYVRIVVPIIFGLIALLGFVGNVLVIIVVVGNTQMRNTTNLLIISLALADLFFIIICVPFTAMAISMPTWPFGDAWCKIYQYTINVTAYASVYTLVLMSLDRYMAVVHPIRSMTIRTERNASLMILASWIIICLPNIPIMFQYKVVEYTFRDEKRSACLNEQMVLDPRKGRPLYGCFFAFAYLIPLLLVSILYGAMIKRLLYGVAPRGNANSESMRSKRRVTRMVVIVVVMFAICWLPIQIILMITYFGNYPNTSLFLAIQITSNCFAYMNSCINPILYAFLSDNFRKSFRKLLCWGKWQPVRMEFERTNYPKANSEPTTRTTGLNNNENCV